MRPSIDDAAIDAAAEDPPLLPLAGAVLGVLLAAGGVLWLLASLFVEVPIPVGSPFVAIVVGLVLFVASMLKWSPGVGAA